LWYNVSTGDGVDWGFQLYEDGTVSPLQYLFGLYGQVYFQLSKNTIPDPYYGIYAPVIRDGAWHNVIATYENDEMKLYQDNILIDSSIVADVSIYGSGTINNQVYYLGPSDPSIWTDQIYVFDKALNLKEILYLWNGGLGI